MMTNPYNPGGFDPTLDWSAQIPTGGTPQTAAATAKQPAAAAPTPAMPPGPLPTSTNAGMVDVGQNGGHQYVPASSPQGQAAAPTAAAPDNRAGIVQAYQQYLGRTPSESDIQAWIGNNNYASGIQNSPEARARQGLTGTAAQPGNPRGTEDSWIGWLQSQTSPDRNAAKQGIYQSRPGSGFYHTGGTSVQDAIARYNKDTGSNAQVVPSQSGDMVDFGDGRGPVDVLNSEGNFWYDEGKGANRIANAGSGGPGGTPGLADWPAGSPMTGGPGGLPGSFEANLKAVGWRPGMAVPTIMGAAPSGAGMTNIPANEGFGQMPPNFMGQPPTAPGAPTASGTPAGPTGFGNDLLDKGYADLVTQMLGGNPMSAAQFESIRAPIDMARTAETNQGLAELADRGILNPGQAGNTAAQIERQIAPQFASAVQQASVQNEQNRRQTLLSALSGGTQRQNLQSQIALQNLSENRLWNEFLANNGMNQQMVQAQIDSMGINSLVPLLQLYLQYAQSTGNKTTTTKGGNSLSGA